MKKFKRIIALLTVALFIFSFAAPTFANTAATTSTQTGASDVAGTKFFNAVSRLGALNVLAGYPDGTFKPGNNITRAEMAAVAVNAIGLKDSAAYAKGKTKFKDVAGDHWAAGFVNVASSQGIIAGYPNGTYKPDANVSYAEVATILVRLLGYGPDVKGTWPVNYISKATELELLKGTEFDPSKPATRGDVALMTDKASVDTAPLEFTGYDNTGKANYAVNKSLTIAKKYLSVAEGEVLIKGVNLTDLTVDWEPAYYDDSNPPKPLKLVTDKNGRVVASGAKLLNSGIVAELTTYIGKKVKVGAQEITLGDGKAWRIIYITPLTGTDNVVLGKVKDDDVKDTKKLDSKANLGSDKNVTEFDVQLTGSDTVKTYKLDTNTSLTVERNRADLTPTNKFGDGDTVELILNDAGRVRYIKAFKYDSPAIVKSFEAKGTNGRTYDTLNVVLPGDTGTTALNTNDNFISDLLITKDGKAAKLADFKAGDYVDFAWKDSANYIDRDITIVKGYTPKTVTGKVTKFSTDKDNDLYVTVDNSVYGGYLMPNRLNGASPRPTAVVVKVNNSEGAYSATEHESKILGSTVTITLDSANKVRYINASTNESQLAGYVKKVSTGNKSGQYGSEYVSGKELTVVDKDGKERKVILDNNSIQAVTVDTNFKGRIVDLKLSNGYAKSGKSLIYDAKTNIALKDTATGLIAGQGYASSSAGTFSVPGYVYQKGTDTVVLDATGSTVKVVKWSDLKDGQTVSVALNAAAGSILIDFVVITQQKAVWGYAIDKYTSYSEDDDANKNIYKVLTKDGVVEYEVASLGDNYIPVSVTGKAIGNDVLTAVVDGANDLTAGSVYLPVSNVSSSAKTFTVNGVSVLVNDSTFVVNALIKDKPLPAEFGNINSNSQVKVFSTTAAPGNPYIADLIVIYK